MRHFFLLALLVSACATAQPRAEQPVPQCLSLCNNNFASCTNEFPGDYGACRQEMQTCEDACQEQKAMERMESADEEVIVPTDAPE